AKLAAQAIVFDVSAVAPRQPQHRDWSGEHQESERQVPLPQLGRIEPAAKQDAAHETDAALGDGHRQQHGHAAGERLGAELRRVGRIRWRVAIAFQQRRERYFALVRLPIGVDLGGKAHGAAAPASSGNSMPAASWAYSYRRTRRSFR